MAVLSALAEAEGLSLSDVARRAHLSTSTAARVLETLRLSHFVSRDEAGRYYVGIGAFEVGSAFLQTAQPQRAARAVMQTLAQQLSETVNLSVLEGNDVVYLDQAAPEGSMTRMFTRIGARAPLHCTGAGKVLIAWRPRGEVERLVVDPLSLFTPATLGTRAALEDELERVRRQGYALDNEERELGVRCIAAPIRNHLGEVVAALSLSAPVPRLNDARVRVSAEVLSQGAEEVSAQLGYRAARTS